MGGKRYGSLALKTRRGNFGLLSPLGYIQHLEYHTGGKLRTLPSLTKSEHPVAKYAPFRVGIGQVKKIEVDPTSEEMGIAQRMGAASYPGTGVV